MHTANPSLEQVIPEIKILNARLSQLNFNQSKNVLINALEDKNQVFHVGVNAATINMMHENEGFREMVNSADLINPDGMSVVYAAKLLHQNLEERVPATDLMQSLISYCAEHKHSIFLFGAEETIVQKLKNILTEKHGAHIITGVRNGFFSSDDEQEIIDQINQSKAEVLLLGMPSPAKERFVFLHRDKMPNVHVFMGVGGAFDVMSGKVKRAPTWVQNIAMEWFYRMMQEPQRLWKRYLLGNSQFIVLVLKDYFRKK